jgi:hypothetical protein
MSYLRYLCLFAYSVLCFRFVFIRIVYPMLLVSLDCPFVIAVRYSLTFIYNLIVCPLKLYRPPLAKVDQRPSLAIYRPLVLIFVLFNATFNNISVISW